MAKKAPTATMVKNTKKKRPGVHSKSKASKNKSGKNYLKKNVGQG